LEANNAGMVPAEYRPDVEDLGVMGEVKGGDHRHPFKLPVIVLAYLAFIANG
jgi:hypothetical protein